MLDRNLMKQILMLSAYALLQYLATVFDINVGS